MLSILHDTGQHSLWAMLLFYMIAPGKLKMTQYPFASVVTPSNSFPWSQAAMNNEMKPHALM